MRSNLFIIILVLALLSLPAWASDIVIRDASIMTMGPQGTIERGSVLIRDGKIAAVGSDIDVPEGAQVVDAQGKWVTPGIIDCHSHIALDSINEGGTNVSSMTGTEDVINADNFTIYRDLAGGVTSANLLHGSANPIGGKNQVVKLRWGKTGEELKFKGAKPGIKFALGENPKRPGIPLYTRGRDRRYPASRMGVEDVIRDAFNRALAYQAEWDEYEEKKARGVSPLIPPRRDLQLEPLVEVLKGERLVHSHCYRADEILMLIRVAEDYGFTVGTFQHVLEGYKVAEEIAEHGAGASTFSDWWAYKVEAYDAIPYNAAIMHNKGIVVSINSDSGEEARHLNQEAAKAMRYGGLDAEDALAMVTINPAKQLRIDDRVGSLEAGKDADVVIWNNFPLSVYAIAEEVYIDGQRYFSREMEAQRLAQLEEEKKRLLEQDKSKKGDQQEKVEDVDVVHSIEEGGRQ
ncbi:MAG TPA: amidohydrolase family protein [Acidobacteriota bacterium]|nr:amidohydrolase family protein [Acidobacteriota bacterium]